VHSFSIIAAIAVAKVELPSAAAIGQCERSGKMVEELTPRNLFSTERFDVARGLLAVKDPKFPDLELAHERNQRDL
jgi:hypothetical protein